uniref:ARAD1B06732p n=1 Tax=Blastobotrys adeninivorans TaxID=409370 RepID=A0A060T5W4_BLAAD
MSDIKSAALYINNTLLAKGYISDEDRLNFSSVDEGEIDHAKNDTRVINVVYSLLKTLERDTGAYEQVVTRANDMKQEIASNKTQIERLQNKLKAAEKDVQELRNERASLRASADAFRAQAVDARETITRLKQTIRSSRVQFANEIRKRDIHISNLKERVHSLNRKTRPIPSVSGSLSRSYNSYSGVTQFQTEEPSAVEKVADTLSKMNANLVEENGRLIGHLLQIRDAIASVTAGVRDGGDSGHVSRVSNHEVPSSAAEVLVRISNADQMSSEINDSIDRIDTIVNSPNFVSVAELKSRQRQVDSLSEQLEQMTLNWKKAVDTLDEWKKLRGRPRYMSSPMQTKQSPKPTKADKPNSDRQVSGTNHSTARLSSARSSLGSPARSRPSLSSLAQTGSPARSAARSATKTAARTNESKLPNRDTDKPIGSSTPKRRSGLKVDKAPEATGETKDQPKNRLKDNPTDQPTDQPTDHPTDQPTDHK